MSKIRVLVKIVPRLTGAPVILMTIRKRMSNMKVNRHAHSGLTGAGLWMMTDNRLESRC
jgi:hypothetical protein